MRHEDENECEQFVRRITRNFLALARTRQQTIICVTNEVGLGVVPDTGLGRVVPRPTWTSEPGVRNRCR